MVKWWYEHGESITSIAKRFNVNKRSIQFLLFPERKNKNLKDREKRGGWKQYYSKEKHRGDIKDHRNYKSKEIKNFLLNKNMGKYDSSADTLLHIKRVSQLLNEAAMELIRRGNVHDNSKLLEPEKSEFDRLTPILKTLTYGSDEYKQSLTELQIALKHHYANNSHHPEHYNNGINDFDLFDLIEMFFDWKAATERTKDGDIIKSIEINKSRFEMSDQLCKIFKNTANSLFKC